MSDDDVTRRGHAVVAYFCTIVLAAVAGLLIGGLI